MVRRQHDSNHRMFTVSLPTATFRPPCVLYISPLSHRYLCLRQRSDEPLRVLTYLTARRDNNQWKKVERDGRKRAPTAVVVVLHTGRLSGGVAASPDRTIQRRGWTGGVGSGEVGRDPLLLTLVVILERAISPPVTMPMRRDPEFSLAPTLSKRGWLHPQCYRRGCVIA